MPFIRSDDLEFILCGMADEPTWPTLWISHYLYGPWKNEFKSPLVLKGNFEKGTEQLAKISKTIYDFMASKGQ